MGFEYIGPAKGRKREDYRRFWQQENPLRSAGTLQINFSIFNGRKSNTQLMAVPDTIQPLRDCRT